MSREKKEGGRKPLREWKHKHMWIFFSLIEVVEKQIFSPAGEQRSQLPVLLAGYPGVCFNRVIAHGVNLDHTYHSLFDFRPHFEIF